MMWDEPQNDHERFLLEAFEANFARLREESGRALAPFIKDAARQQVLLYYRRLHGLAEKVAETEVRLVLPDQRSPAGRRYTLEGVVDIVQDDEQTVMYDLKTYLDADAAGDNLDPHYRQLNVYAHIWAGLHGEALDAVALIATKPTRSVARALRSGDATRIAAAIAGWDPVLPITVNPSLVDEIVHEFGAVVDEIEGRHFAPPDLAVLRAPARPGGREPFSQDVCLNCDGRFACPSYRQLVRSQAAGRGDAALRDSAADFGGDVEREDWRESELARAPGIAIILEPSESKGDSE